MKKQRLALSIVILFLGLAGPYIIANRYGNEYLPVAALITTILASIGPIYSFLQNLDGDEEENRTSGSHTSSDIVESSQNQQKTIQGEESFSSTSSRIDAGGDIRVGGSEVHYHNYLEVPNLKKEEEEEPIYSSSSSSSLDFSEVRAIPSVVEGGDIENVYFSQVKGEYGLTPVSFWHRLFSESDIHSTVDQASKDPSFKEFKEALGRVAPYTWGHEKASFAISQMEGQWYGYGLNNFIETLSKQEKAIRTIQARDTEMKRQFVYLE